MRRRNVEKLLGEASEILGEATPEAVEEAELENGEPVYFLDGAIQLARPGGVLVPTLNTRHVDRLPSVVVDMGAVPYVCDGADVMAPGIVEIRGPFEEGDLVVVRDVNHGKALAVGRALKPSEKIEASGKGKVVENLHYVGDRIWKALA